MKRHTFLSSILSLSLVASAAYAAPIADVHMGAAGVDFALKGLSAGSITLTVSGPGDFHAEKTFDRQAPFFAADSLEPGYYKWTPRREPRYLR